MTGGFMFLRGYCLGADEWRAEAESEVRRAVFGPSATSDVLAGQRAAAHALRRVVLARTVPTSGSVFATRRAMLRLGVAVPQCWPWPVATSRPGATSRRPVPGPGPFATSRRTSPRAVAHRSHAWRSLRSFPARVCIRCVVTDDADAALVPCRFRPLPGALVTFTGAPRGVSIACVECGASSYAPPLDDGPHTVRVRHAPSCTAEPARVQTVPWSVDVAPWMRTPAHHPVGNVTDPDTMTAQDGAFGVDRPADAERHRMGDDLERDLALALVTAGVTPDSRLASLLFPALHRITPRPATPPRNTPHQPAPHPSTPNTTT